jgi:hypothetical protein
MAGQQFNTPPQYNVPLIMGGVTSKDWYFFLIGIFRGLPPANVSPVTVGASPYDYIAPVKGSVIVQGGTVTSLEFSRDGTSFYDVGQTSGMFLLNQSDYLRITHAGAPTVTFVPT